MARPRTKTLTEVELDIMKAVWSKGEVTTEDIMAARRAQGRDPSDGATRTMLSILVDKGYLTRRRKGRGFLYKAKVDREQATRKMVLELLKRAFGGKASPMVAAMINSRVIFDEDLDEIKRLIAQREKELRG